MLRKKVLLSVLAVIILVLICVSYYFCNEPVGGKVSERDLIGGYDLYITEEYLFEWYLFDGYTVASEHNIYKVNDRDTKEQIIKLLDNLKCVREFNSAHDLLLGGDAQRVNHRPSICIICGDIGYFIRYFNREDQPDSLPILQEVSNKRIFTVSRIDMTECPADISAYDYAAEYLDHDTLNRSGFGYGWYSVMDDAESEKLVELLYGINEECAEIYRTDSLDTRNR